MFVLYPPAGTQNLRVSGQILKRADGSYSVPEADVPGLLAVGWIRAPQIPEQAAKASPQIPEIRKTRPRRAPDKDDRS